METFEHGADLAMGIELVAIEIEQQLEWAESQGRFGDAVGLQAQLRSTLDQLADVAESIPRAA